MKPDGLCRSRVAHRNGAWQAMVSWLHALAPRGVGWAVRADAQMDRAGKNCTAPAVSRPSARGHRTFAAAGDARSVQPSSLIFAATNAFNSFAIRASDGRWMYIMWPASK